MISRFFIIDLSTVDESYMEANAMKQSHAELFFLLKQVDLQLTQLFEGELDISLTRYEIMRILKDETAVTQTYLQRQLMINQAAITRHLKVLEEKQLLTRIRNPKNNREMLVSISGKGKDLLQSCELSRHDMTEKLFDQFTDQDLKTVRSFLDTLKITSRQMLDQHTEEE